MNMEEVIENELKCVQRNCCRLENECAKCDLVLPIEEIINAYNEALRIKKENAELKDKLNNLSKVAEVRLANCQKYEQENAELKRDKSELCNAINEEGKARVKLNEKLSKAKGFIEKLLIVSCNSEILIQYPNCKEVLEARVALEQFLMENK